MTLSYSAMTIEKYMRIFILKDLVIHFMGIHFFGPPKGRSYDFRSVSSSVRQCVSASVTRFNWSKNHFDFLHEGRGPLVGKTDVGRFWSKILVSPNLGI